VVEDMVDRQVSNDHIDVRNDVDDLKFMLIDRCRFVRDVLDLWSVILQDCELVVAGM